MLRLLESKREKIAAQAELIQYLHAVWKERERRLVVWRPDSREMDIVHNNEYWFVSVSPNRDQNTARYWNSIGSYHENGNLQIAVEINIPIASNERMVSGFFAKDDTTGIIYLMHDGGVGGGRKGVGKTAFLAWSGEKPIPASDSQGEVRLGIVVTPIKPRVIDSHIARFAQKVLDFKQAVKNGEITDDVITTESQCSYDDYYREFSGKKKGERSKEFEYISRHGDIVDALYQWRSRRSGRGERIIKNAYMDLGIAVSNKLTEIYEVKTNTDRQTLYTAIGQILVHDAVGTDSIQRYIVIPCNGSMPHDVERALKRFQIKVLHFELTDIAVRILG